MKSHRIILPIAIATLISGCFGDEDDDDPISHDDLEEVTSTGQSLTKGTIGAVNGQADYCDDPANKCVTGEGDCDYSFQCVTGLKCNPDNGLKYGFPWNYDVCGPTHCSNGQLDPGLGETAVDCGGPCGSCTQNCTTEPGAQTFCDSCLCARGEGDCDSDRQCQPGLVCADAPPVGERWGYRRGYDVCLPRHCENGTQDSGETGVDVGGPCSPGPVIPALNVFFSEYAEGSSDNHHLEIYNAGSEAQSCTVNVYYEGSMTPSSIVLTSQIAPGGLFVLCRSGGVVGQPPCNQSTTALRFTGDDAIELVCGAQTQDIIGQIGFDPGTQWGTGNASTYDNTMRRKCTVTTGDKVGSNAFVPATEWDGFALGTYGDLGVRNCAP